MTVALLVLGGLGIAFILIAVLLARAARRAREQLDAHGLLAEAEVLMVWQEVAGYRVRYRFTPPGAEKPVVRSEISACLRALVPEPGDTVQVRYDPRDPLRRARMLAPDESRPSG
ncbi:MAG TPA: DUF3592 domain-containing protein [Burkholderiales bacterium]